MSELRGDGAEASRLREVSAGHAPWRQWGPYLSERGWGTVRHDYSRTGDPWASFPHEHSRSRAYRWDEDGLAGISDDRQLLCLALAFWNGRDPILKERIFGLSTSEGNHGEDPKEYWWYLDATPTYSWMRWRYLYPQVAFPYSRLIEENQRRTRADVEFELADTGVFEAGYWEITADYAKAGPQDILLRIRARNVGRASAMLDVLPTLWFRNTWSWGLDERRPTIRTGSRSIVADHHLLGRRVLAFDGEPSLLFCDNETNTQRLWGMANHSQYPKDGINDHVVHGAPTVNPHLTGTKVAVRYRLSAPAGTSTEIRLRLGIDCGDLEEDFTAVMGQRRREADAFHQGLMPAGIDRDGARVMRQAAAGLLWNRMYYHFNVRSWLTGDPAGSPPPPEHRQGRNTEWRHLDARDVISAPDKWESPWCRAWDLAFSSVALANIDAEAAKQQLVMIGQDRFLHPNGQIPAQEANFSETCPPIHAWATLKVWEADGRRDRTFLERMLHKLLLNFTWWVNRRDREGRGLLDGGFIGMGEFSSLDTRTAFAEAGPLEQADATAWLAMCCANLLEMSLALAVDDPAYEDLACKFLSHFGDLALVMEQQAAWDEEHGFYYDVLRLRDGTRISLRARAMVGLMPLFATLTLPRTLAIQNPVFAQRLDTMLGGCTELRRVLGHLVTPGPFGTRLLSLVSPVQLRRILRVLLDERELLSPVGVRTLSKAHRDHPLGFRLGDITARVDYEPGDASSGILGGNFNWRGPVCLPVNYLVIESLRRFHAHLGPGYTVDCPSRSGRAQTLAQVADEIARRTQSIFRIDAEGMRPVFGTRPLFQQPPWRDHLMFHEFFHGETGAGLGASHHTGWTGLVASLISKGQTAPDENREVAEAVPT